MIKGGSSLTEISQLAAVVRRGCGSPYVASTTVMFSLNVVCAISALRESAVFFDLSQVALAASCIIYAMSDQTNFINWLLMSTTEWRDDHSPTTHSKA
jgi:hypothetical protein